MQKAKEFYDADVKMAQQFVPEKEEEEFEELQLKYFKKKILGKEVQDRVTNYMGILCEDKEYEIKLTIRELPDKKKEKNVEISGPAYTNFQTFTGSNTANYTVTTTDGV